MRPRRRAAAVSATMTGHTRLPAGPLTPSTPSRKPSGGIAIASTSCAARRPPSAGPAGAGSMGGAADSAGAGAVDNGDCAIASEPSATGTLLAADAGAKTVTTVDDTAVAAPETALLRSPAGSTVTTLTAGMVLVGAGPVGAMRPPLRVDSWAEHAPSAPSSNPVTAPTAPSRPGTRPRTPRTSRVCLRRCGARWNQAPCMMR